MNSSDSYMQQNEPEQINDDTYDSTSNGTYTGILLCLNNLLKDSVALGF